MRVNADRDRCIGAGMCTVTAPNLFDQDEDGRVLLLAKGDVASAELEAAREAVALCPAGALSLHDGGDDTTPDLPHVDTPSSA